MTQEFADVRTVAAWLGWTPKMVDDTADAGNIPRSMDRREIAVRPFLEYAAARRAAGKQAAANVRAVQEQALWGDIRDMPIIIDVPRGQWVRGTRSITSTKSAGAVLEEYTDPITGRRIVRRRNVRHDFFPNE